MLFFNHYRGKIINVTLWNSFADQMDKFIANQVPGIRVIVILQFASLTYIRGMFINFQFQLYFLFDYYLLPLFRSSNGIHLFWC